ncbi:MFS transporter, DHA2 family, multidrug resistance protein [Brevibacterium sandarakinum]|uniref:MFS transporter, DHA2 family, multidrug resistance protein n=1 Tax=Brevibacterium sandarakinum TaxID=629680 RepID=A0A1H1NXN7_BRESA|nr:MFS transporter [Brevibacterium sandarakinum]SDS03713.1 MFS transporter, DHA2 family, multidrug resistance protein [Brevibacterium sandarakinum]
MPTRTSHSHDRRSRWLGLAVLTLPVILTSMDITILHIAIPTITQELTPTPSQTLWILDAYGFLLAGLLIVMGNIGDRIGRRRLLLIGAAVFGAASTLAAFAPGPEILIAARALMGIGGATLMPSTLSLIRNMFTDPAERTRAIGIWTASLSGGIALGPIIGGALLEAFWWGSVFLINVPVIVLLLVLAPRFVPEYQSPASARLDMLSVLLSFAAILPVVWAIKTAAEELAFTAPAVVGLVAGVLAGTVFLIRQRRLEEPLVEVGLFANPRFSGAVLGAGLAMFSLVGVMFYSAQYLQLVAGLSPLIAAVAMLPIMAAVGGMSVLASVLVPRFGYPLIFGAGAAVAAAGMFTFSRVPVDDGLILAITASAFIGAGIAPMMTLATDVVVGSAPPARSGAASALSETAAELGAALGIAVLGSIGTALYQSRVLDGVPTDLPTEATGVVSSSLGAALSVAEQLPADAATHLNELARHAFTDGLGAATVTGGLVLIVTAIACPILLHRGRPQTRSTDGTAETGQQ